MLKASLKSLLAHKLRLALSAVAVVLGVAFVAGTLVFTDTLGKTFDDLFKQTSADVTVSQKTAFSADTGGGGTGGHGVPAALVDQIRKVDGVAAVRGEVGVDGVQVVGRNGKAVGTQGPPTLGLDWSPDPSLTSLKITEGRPPQRAGEIGIDTVTAKKAKLSVGDTTTVLTPKERVTAQVVGIFKFGDTGNLAGASLTAFDQATAQKLLLEPGYYTDIAVKATDGVSNETVRDRIAPAVGSGFDVRTAKEQADENAKDVQQGLKFINIFLLVFAGVAVFVGAFIILNTFSMLVAQRTRELALLRAVGASRRQVTRSVLIEAIGVGIFGGTLGLGLGLVLAVGLKALFGLIGLEMGDTPLVIAPKTVFWSYAVAIVVTVVAAYFPARRGAKTPPVAAMRDDIAMPARSLHRRTVIGTVVAGIGVVLLGVGLGPAKGGNAASLVGLGAALVFVGVAVLSPILSRPAVRVLGALYPRLWGRVGHLSRENALRNPRRTAATASALMIGLALVGTMSVVSASMKSSFDHQVNKTLGAEFIVQGSTSAGFSPQIASSLKSVSGVKSVSQQRFGAVQIDGSTKFINAVDPATVDDALKMEYIEGSTAALAGRTVMVDDRMAESKHYRVGQTVAVRFQDGTQADLRIGAIYKSNGALNGYVTSLDTLAQAHGLPRDAYVYVKTQAGASTDTVGKALDSALKAYPNVSLKDQSGFKKSIRGQIDQLLYMIYALLALAIVIAVLGIINTLALSVIERTREIGLLRAVGMSRRQLRRMVRLESVVISLFGAALGLVIGVAFGWALQSALASQGIENLSIPVASLVTFFAISAIIGVFAAIWPAIRASRLDVLRAITTE